MPESAFDLFLPARPVSCAIFASPHSGRDYGAFGGRVVLDPLALRSSEDAFVDQLFAAAPELGAPLLAARVPRAYVDFNRGAEEMDPALIEGLGHRPLNPRIGSGLGVIPRVVANGRAIYRGKLGRDEAEARLRRCWHPYHACLRALLDDQVARFGEAILFDCHSMPHEAVDAGGRFGRRADIVLGDRFGVAAAPWVSEGVEAAFTATGLRVARNAPFAGAYVAEQYGRPGRGWHVIQIEIDRALYMDERRVEPGPGFDTFRAMMDEVVADLVQLGALGRRLAAE